MTLKLTTSHLTRTLSGHLAFCNDCLCNVFETFGSCNCLSENFGTKKTLGTLTVEVTGSMTPQAAVSPACSAPASCASVNGTYVIACDGDTDQIWRIDGFVCTSGGVDYYYSNTIRIIYQPTNLAVTVRIGSSKTTHVGANPYPTLTLVGTQPVAGSVRQWSASQTLGTFSGWTYVLGGTCRASCNLETSYRGCNTAGSLTLSQSWFVGPAANDSCDPSSQTVTASLSAAS